MQGGGVCIPLYFSIQSNLLSRILADWWGWRIREGADYRGDTTYVNQSHFNKPHYGSDYQMSLGVNLMTSCLVCIPMLLSITHSCVVTIGYNCRI